MKCDLCEKMATVHVAIAHAGSSEPSKSMHLCEEHAEHLRNSASSDSPSIQVLFEFFGQHQRAPTLEEFNQLGLAEALPFERAVRLWERCSRRHGSRRPPPISDG